MTEERKAKYRIYIVNVVQEFDYEEKHGVSKTTETRTPGYYIDHDTAWRAHLKIRRQLLLTASKDGRSLMFPVLYTEYEDDIKEVV